MATKLEEFLTEKKIDQRRIIAASARLERLTPADRAIKLAYRQARKKEDGAKPQGLGERHSGRPVSQVTLAKALAGKPITGPAKTRILRAVNRILEQRKQEQVELTALFAS